MSPEEALADLRDVAQDHTRHTSRVPDDWQLRVALAIDALADRIETLQESMHHHPEETS